MGGEQAANVLATVRRDAIEAKGGAWSAEEEAAFKAPIREQYEDAGQSVLRHRAALGRRRHRSGATRACAWRWAWRSRCGNPIPETRFGVFRM